MVRFDKAIYYPLLYKFILSERLGNSLLGSGVSLFTEFINIGSIFHYICVEFIIYLYTFLVTSLRYREYTIWPVSFSKFSEILPDFACPLASSNLSSACLGIYILILSLIVSY